MFIENTSQVKATGEGGAIYTSMLSNCNISNSVFIGNRCTKSQGNAIFCYESNNHTKIKNCIFYNNSGKGATVYLSSDSNIENCSFYKNYGENYVGGLYGGKAKNCIFYNNTPQEVLYSDITYSLIRRGYEGEGNFEADPLFINPDSLDFSLQPNSPCIDVGDPKLSIGSRWNQS